MTGAYPEPEVWPDDDHHDDQVRPEDVLDGQELAAYYEHKRLWQR